MTDPLSVTPRVVRTRHPNGKLISIVVAGEWHRVVMTRKPLTRELAPWKKCREMVSHISTTLTFRGYE